MGIYSQILLGVSWLVLKAERCVSSHHVVSGQSWKIMRAASTAKGGGGNSDAGSAQIFGGAHLHDVLEALGEGQLSLHHVELCQVPATLRVFGSKRWPKGEHVGKGPVRRQERGRSSPAHKHYTENPIHELTFLPGSQSFHVSIMSLTCLMALLCMMLLHSSSGVGRGVIHIPPQLSHPSTVN